MFKMRSVSFSLLLDLGPLTVNLWIYSIELLQR